MCVALSAFLSDRETTRRSWNTKYDDIILRYRFRANCTTTYRRWLCLERQVVALLQASEQISLDNTHKTETKMPRSMSAISTLPSHRISNAVMDEGVTVGNGGDGMGALYTGGARRECLLAEG